MTLILSEKQFEAAYHLLNQTSQKRNGVEAARLQLVKGLSQVDAAECMGITKQRVYSSVVRIKENLQIILTVKKKLEQLGGDISKKDIYKISDIVKNISPKSKSGLAAKLVMVDNLPIEEASKKVGIPQQNINLAIKHIESNFVRVIEAINML